MQVLMLSIKILITIYTIYLHLGIIKSCMYDENIGMKMWSTIYHVLVIYFMWS